MTARNRHFCHHVKANGNLCRAEPLRDQQYCYFHLLTRERLRRRFEAERRKQPLRVPIFEDAGSVQLSLTDLANAILSGSLEVSRGRLVLSVLQTAIANCHRVESFADDYGYFLTFHPSHLEDGTEFVEPEEEQSEGGAPALEGDCLPEPGKIVPQSFPGSPAEAAS